MIDPQENKVCPICHRPKQGGVAGSITQWISVCRCNVGDERTEDQSNALRICADCRKRVNPIKGGTITQWIFSENFCKCENPTLVPMAALEIEQRRNSTAENLVDEVFLDVDPAAFPVDRYKPLQFIGKGALGEVYLCRDVLLKKKVAVKCLLNVTGDRVVSFQNEAKIVSKLNHESVISVMDFGITNSGRPFMVMEYFPGKSLQEIIAESGRIAEANAIELLKPICRSLEYLHESNVLHRDLKPSNILVRVTPGSAIHVRLIDFGLSKTTQDAQSKTLMDGNTIVGTPGYMSPDQIGGQSYDARSEIYSLGCIMFEMLTGTQPYGGETALEVLNNHVHAPVPSVEDFDCDASPPLAEVIEKCLSKQKQDRFKTVGELLTAIESCDSSITGAAQAGSATVHFSSDSTTLSPARTWKSGWIIGLLFCVLLMPGAFMMRLFKPFSETQKNTVRLAMSQAADIHYSKVYDALDEKDTLEGMSQMSIEAPERPELPEGKSVKLRGQENVSVNLKKFAETAPKNPRIILDDCLITAKDVAAISALNPIEVSLVNCFGVTDDTLNELSKSSNLKMLTLDGCKRLTPRGFKHLQKLPRLFALSIKGCGLGNAVIEPIAGIKSLTHLSLNGNEVTGSGFLYSWRGFRKSTVPVNIFLDLGAIGPGQKKAIEKSGVIVHFTKSGLGRFGLE